MILRNLRAATTPDGPTMCADFTIADGRQGSVCVPLREFEAHGEAILEQAALFVARELRRRDSYRPPEADRFNEIR
jgi:hypothetical protein